MNICLHIDQLEFSLSLEGHFFFTENTPNSLLFRGLRVKERIVCMKGDAFNFVPLNFQDPHWEVKMHP